MLFIFAAIWKTAIILNFMKNRISQSVSVVFAFVFSLIFSFAAKAGHHDSEPIVEVRVYKILPGKMDAWLDFFHNELAAPMEAAGMKIVAAYTSLDDPDTFIWIREFPSEAEREPIRKKFYGSDLWQKDLKLRLRDTFDKVEKVYNITPSHADSLMIPGVPQGLQPTVE